MEVADCQDYRGTCDGRICLAMPDGRSRFKVYFLSVIGRQQPDLFEWGACDDTPNAFKSRLLDSDFRGIGFITAFPHITKVFRYSPQVETVVDVRYLDTQSFEDISGDRGDGYYEFACYAEAVIVSDEYDAWAVAQTVPEYLKKFSPSSDYLIASPGKLSAYWNQVE